MALNVLKLEDVLAKDAASIVQEPAAVEKLATKSKTKKLVIPRGKAKSGRPWKSEKQRFKSIIKTRGIKVSNAFDKQMKLREDLKTVKTISRARKQERQEAKEAKKQRRRENLEKQKKNALKSEVVQVIKNPAKIKRMNKKQLRSIAKRDTTKIQPNKT